VCFLTSKLMTYCILWGFVPTCTLVTWLYGPQATKP
jgi:hypothetical protein